MKKLIFDPIRKKRVVLTPEEGVRQWLIKELTESKGYPSHLMSCEFSLTINSVKYRADLVLYGKNMQPLLLAECKAPNIKITQKSFDQILRYNLALKVKYLIVTNGYKTFLAQVATETGEYTFLTEIPHYNELSK
ncbi:MAG: type I restriction enzyme HsdR N-terminal domain-containing protein [Bacteroidales bacterium]|nr:type I restriction enzyme HsdR N-terminal domain-containing protein [Bacteroidales bacterium]MDD4656375.1 type I restriction enzyme HsdR N-terminal domain-containing protein [Bacteroidales bacterium]